MLKKKGRKNFKNYEQYWLIFVLAIIGVFIAISLYIGLKQSIWFDESYSINLAKHSLSDLVRLTAIDVHPPAYYIFLHIWGRFFGFSELSLRLSSVIAMSIAIFLMSVFLRRLFNRRLSLIILVFIGLSPMIIRYGFEIRMYALATMFVVFATLILHYIEQQAGKARRLLQILYAGLVALGMLTLYYTIVIWLTHLGYLIYKTIKSRKPIFKQDFWLVYLLAMGLFSPWLVTSLKQFTNGALAPISEPFTLINLLGVFSFNILYRPAWQLNQLDGLLLLILVILFGVAIGKTLQPKIVKQTGVDLLIFLAVGPIVLEFLICLIKPMYVERYLIYSAPFLIALLVCLFRQAKVEQRAPILKLSFLLLLMLIGIKNLNQLGNFNFQRMQKPDIKEVARTIETEKLPILTDSPYEAIELSYYLGDEIYFYAPYERLKGGYAPLDKSEYKITDINKLPKNNCFNYVYYDANLNDLLSKNNFKIEQGREDVNKDHSLKYTTVCRK